MLCTPSNVNRVVCILFMIQVLWDKDLHPFQQDTVAGGGPAHCALHLNKGLPSMEGIMTCSESLAWWYKAPWDILGKPQWAELTQVTFLLHAALEFLCTFSCQCLGAVWGVCSASRGKPEAEDNAKAGKAAGLMKTAKYLNWGKQIRSGDCNHGWKWLSDYQSSL